MDHQGNNVDHRVVVKRPIDQIRRDVESGSLNPLVMDLNLQNLLHVAVAENKFEIIQYLGTEWCGDVKELVSAVDGYGETPLHIACSVASPNLKVVEYLLDAFHANDMVNVWSTNSPLHVAITMDNVELVNLLVSRAVRGRANPLSFFESIDGDGRTPLLFACTRTQHNSPSIVRCLVKWERPNGMDSRMRQPRDKNGRTALHLACASCTSLDQVTELVNNYSDDVEVQDSTNMRPLHVAVASAAGQNGSAASLSIVRFLVTEAGADVNAKDGKGWTPLHHACQSSRSENTTLVRLLVANGAETLSGDMLGRTPLHVTSMSDNTSLVAHFVEREGTAVDSRHHKGNFSRPDECALENVMGVRYILNQRADAEKVHKQRQIHVACSNLQYDSLKVLVERYGENVNVADRCGRTPLHKACMSNIGITNAHASANVVRFLLDNGANVDVRDEDGKTPLLYAVSRGNIDVAKLLVSYGANKLCTDRFQNNVLHVARTADIARLLIEDVSPSARGIAYALLTSPNSRGDTPIKIAHRRFLNVEYSDDRNLGRYISSFTEFQVAVVPPQLHNNKKRTLFEACSQLNPNLSPFQRRYVARICSLLGRSELVEDLKFHILGFLTPLDLMNG